MRIVGIKDLPQLVQKWPLIALSCKLVINSIRQKIHLTSDILSHTIKIMNNGNLKESLVYLGISATELADLLDVNIRTVQRWVSGVTEIPMSTERVLEAWSLLQRLGLPWRPDGNHLLSLNDLRSQVELHKANALEIANLIRKLNARGGAAAPWAVNLSAKKATLEKMWVSFYILPNGGFSPQSYGRTDKKIDIHRDKELIEDAIVCIAEEIGKQHKKQLEANWEVVNI